jgi:hypothetical protein
LAKLYANENFPLPGVKRLRELGHDVLTTIEAGRANQSIEDQDVLNFAASQGRAVLTLNRKHFVQLHQSKVTHSGIIVCAFDPDFEGQARRIHDQLQNVGDLAQQLIRTKALFLATSVERRICVLVLNPNLLLGTFSRSDARQFTCGRLPNN